MEPLGGLWRLLLVEVSVAITGEQQAASSAGAAELSVDGPFAPELTVADSFHAFYEAHHRPIARALGLTLGNAELGTEAADEAMTRAYQRWSSVRTYANPQGWIYRVGLNWARSFLRRRKRIALTERPVDAATHDRAPADPALAAALAELDDKHRAVVVLRYLLDWSVEQTAEALDIAPGTVKSRLHRALAHLERELGENEPPEDER